MITVVPKPPRDPRPHRPSADSRLRTAQDLGAHGRRWQRLTEALERVPHRGQWR